MRLKIREAKLELGKDVRRTTKKSQGGVAERDETARNETSRRAERSRRGRSEAERGDETARNETSRRRAKRSGAVPYRLDECAVLGSDFRVYSIFMRTLYRAYTMRIQWHFSGIFEEFYRKFTGTP